ncbi:hypothetical protein AB0G04_00060 [Actinoplanes sp. NPDC023801]|uniref:hypothetical protein n=1 Tax=Actinoplanes sp. NPDC023801 TaxID=3154595 RepID=UPI003405D2EB
MTGAVTVAALVGLMSLFAGVALGWYLRSTNDWCPDCTEPGQPARDSSMLRLPPKTLSR